MNHRVLVVDDDELVLSGLSGSLAEEGYDVLTASTSQEALEQLRGKQVDIVLTDLVMDGMDGMALLRRLRESEPDLPVVVITAHGTATSAIEAVREGASDYIQKPARPEEIAHRLRTVLDAHGLRRKLLKEREATVARSRRERDRHARMDRMGSIALFAEGLAAELTEAVHELQRDAPRLLKALPDDSPMRPLAESADAAAKRVGSLIRSLRHAAAPETGGNDTLALDEVVREALASPAVRDAQHGRIEVPLDARFQGELPPMQGTRRRVRQAVSLLVAHALEAAGGDHPRVTVATSLRHHPQPAGHYDEAGEGDFLCVEVRHTGRSDPEHLDRAFEPYFAVRRLGRKRGGGFGLTTVVAIARGHGGFITCGAEPPGDTVVSVGFPVVPEAADAPAPARPAYAGSERIAVVDDHAEHRKAAAELLGDLGYRVATASNSSEALALFDGTDGVDLVVMDLVLGEAADGVEVFRRILERRPGQRGILAGGFAETDRTVAAHELGLVAYVRKPFTAESLGRAVREALDG